MNIDREVRDLVARREITAIHLSGRDGTDFSHTRDWASGISGR